MLEYLKNFFAPVDLSAAGQLPDVPPPKVKPNPQALPSYLRTANPGATSLPINDRRLANTDITTFRNRANTRQVLRELVAASPDLAGVVFSYIRVAVSSGYTLVARNPDGSFNREASHLAATIATRMDMLNDYSDGFSGTLSLRSISESMLKELMTYGAMSCELVLDKGRLPKRIQPISTTQIEFIPDKGLLRPVQKLSGAEINLDIPTFFMTQLDQELLEPYASSPLEPAIQPVLFSQDFMNDLRRIVKRAVHPRLDVTINEEKFRKNMPDEIAHDAKAMNAYMDDFINTLESQINGLRPEEALVKFDLIGIEYLNNGNSSLSDEWKTLQAIADSKLATGGKTLPAILGHGSGSSNIASTETLLFLKNAAGAGQYKLNEIFSRVFTLAVRLFGMDVVVDFKYDPIELRPDNELESFRAQKQSRVLELLSLGMITDDEASISLNGRLPHAGAPVLSGTNFMSKKVGAEAENPDGESNGGSTANQKMGSDQPKDTRGGNKKASPVKAVK